MDVGTILFIYLFIYLFIFGRRYHSFIYLSIYLSIYLFIYLWLCWVFVAARGLSLVAGVGAALRCGARASHCGGFSCCEARALRAWASVAVARRL